MNFELSSPFSPTGDQPEAIAALSDGIKSGVPFQTLLGVTGSGKTFTIANVIKEVRKPTLILSHNKTLAAQLYSEFKAFFPNNAVEYFVSYYDYYQPEAYLPTTDTRDRRFYSFAFTDGMPKLNTNNEEVIQYFCKICEDWVREFDIDGIRFDVGNEVSHRFLKRIREHLKTIKPDIYLLGEIWHDASQWLQGDEYDSVMNYPLLSGIHDFFLDKTMKKEEFEYMVNRCYTMYMQQNNDVLFNLLDSHDTERLMNRFHDLDKFYQQLAILFTLPGSPCIYYGTEIAMEGAHDPDCRRCMPWSEIESEENQKKIATLRKLIMLRRNEKVCRSLHFHFPNGYENDRCVEYIKLDEVGNKIEVLLNASDEEIKVKGDGEVLFAREFDGEILGVNGTLIRRM